MVAPGSTPQRSAYPHIVVWGSSGVLTLVLMLLTSTTWPATRIGPAWLLPLLAVTSIIFSSLTVELPVAPRASSDVTISEAAVLPAVVLLHPGWAVLVALLGEVVSSTRAAKHPGKIVFNAGWTIVGTAAAAVVFDTLWSGSVDSPRTAGASLLAAATYIAINLVALYGVAHAISDQPLRDIVARGSLDSLSQSMAVASVGILGAVMLVTSPWLVPLLGVPLVLARSRGRTRERFQLGLQEERDRFDRTIAGASDGIVLVDRGGRVRVWNAAAEAVTGRPGIQAIGQLLVSTLVLVDIHGEDLDLDARLDECRNAYGPESFPAIVANTGRAIVVSASADASGGESVLILRDVTRQQEVERMREDLVSRVSHELRTPLATTTGFLETALGRWEDLDDEQRKTLLQRGYRASRRLARVVEGLLVRSRIEEGGATARPQPVAVAATLETLIEDLRGSVSLPIEFVAPHDLVAQVDPLHLQQIIEHLILNADRYGATRIEVAVVSAQGEAVIEVRDHGPGVNPMFVPQLFDPFSQASVGLRRTAAGLGLGLSIVRGLVEANAGRISYDDAPGGGALFRLHLPSVPCASETVGVEGCAT